MQLQQKGEDMAVFDTRMLFGSALAEVCLFTSWPLHSVHLFSLSMVVCLLSTFCCIPLATYYLIMSMMHKQELNPKLWIAAMMTRQALICWTLLHPLFFAATLCTMVLIKALIACCYRKELCVLLHTSNSLRFIFYLIVLFFSFLGGHRGLTIACFVFSILPLKPMHARDTITELLLCYLYCYTWNN